LRVKKEWIEEKVYLEVDYTDLLNIGRITIENSKRSYRKMKAE
jgi:hypothetical protein